ncbi:exodeoxyribonuclease VII small subunit [Pelosinus baikalensis]|uniref:Exodeoxyribonuclease 7 small subunit n=1 Tax=Pelosinus baikalensis TaxID=2892015 RepID=A0ABS8HMD7_9FIRM|nr:exodeoxyribonuclease VII small subunit [Pelosinus baikalensis]MCC5464341.1 exodeoxyribonuclease VII small subunit [Pelosinus baikalensis]
MVRAKKKEDQYEISFEQALEKLEAIVKQLEKGELPLNESLEHFAEGINLSKNCLQKLNFAEQQIDKILSEEKGKIIERPLQLQEDGSC